ncbi:MAG: adenylyl-sulfate kinase [Prolixibacteraceae bacterium]|nr:adenylyl-sulfate kinase [Prolixibacteraceae bacterium]
MNQNNTLTSSDKFQLNTNTVLWFTGLSGSGKTTIASALEKRLIEEGYKVLLLDGDDLRKGLNKDLGFSEADRMENLRRASEVAKLFAGKGFIVLCSFVSPTENLRSMTKEIIGDINFTLIFVNTPLDICEERDVKGLYAKARAGLIPDFTGISAPFEEPVNPDITVNTTKMNVDECVNTILDYLNKKY